MVSRKDVAKLAGTSEQTVSYILNGTRKFSPELVDKVKAAAKELNYQPDIYAKGLATKRTKSICVAISDISNPLFGSIVKSLNYVATKAGYFVSFIDTINGFDKVVAEVSSRRIEGMFISLVPGENTDSLIRRFVDSGMKVVLGNKTEDKYLEDKVAYVTTDLKNGMFSVVDYLSKLGHKNIAYLSGLDIHSNNDIRYSAFVTEYKKLFGTQPIVIENDPPYSTAVEDGFNTAEKLFKSHSDVTAIITTNDLMAYGVIEYCRKNKIKVGRDISVIGIDNIIFSQWVSPPLTSLNFDTKRYGEVVFESIRAYIETGERPNDALIPCEIIERESVVDLTKK